MSDPPAAREACAAGFLPMAMRRAPGARTDTRRKTRVSAEASRSIIHRPTREGRSRRASRSAFNRRQRPHQRRRRGRAVPVAATGLGAAAAARAAAAVPSSAPPRGGAARLRPLSLSDTPAQLSRRAPPNSQRVARGRMPRSLSKRRCKERHGFGCSARINSAARSPTITHVACVFPDGGFGITEASAMRTPCTPMSLSRRSTTSPSRHEPAR